MRIWMALLALPLAAHPGMTAPPADPGMAAALPDIVAPLREAVVNITILKAPRPPAGDASQGAGRVERAFGSGFIIDPAGLIVTNRHVVEGAVKVTVTLNDERIFPATLVAANVYPDIALLKIEAPAPLAVSVWGDSDALRLGETVVAIGNPLGLATSITVGVVSALNRNVSSTVIDDFIQTDTPINQGNSGGPLFNLRGEVVGVTWAIVTPTSAGGSVGLGLAIPSATAQLVVGQMRRYGRLRAGFVGMELQPITPELATALRLPAAVGGIIVDVPRGGPADRAGLREGEVVVQLGGRRVADARAMMRQMAEHPPGSRMPVVVWRNGLDVPLELEVAEFPAAFDPVGPSPLADWGPPVATPTLGLRLSPLDEPARRALGITQRRPGLLVEGVAPNSMGATLGFGRGDLIFAVGGTPVATIDAFAAALAHLQPGRGTIMQVEMQGRLKWIALPPP